MRNILIVDDEPKIQRYLTNAMTMADWQPMAAYTGQEALNILASQKVDLVILDLGLPDIDGLEVLRQVRETSIIPIIILTARDGEADKVRGLELGADDYLTKPFGTPELEARIQAVLRRVDWTPQPQDKETFDSGDLSINFRAHRVVFKGEELHLTPTEYELLRLLINHEGEVLTHGDLLAMVWGEEYRNDIAILRVNISRLRQKIEENPKNPSFILTIPGIGYTFQSK